MNKTSMEMPVFVVEMMLEPCNSHMLSYQCWSRRTIRVLNESWGLFGLVHLSTNRA